MDTIFQDDGITEPTRVATVTQAYNKSISRECYLASLFMHISDRQCWGKFIKDLENSHTLKQYNYPKNLTRTYALIQNYWVPHNMGQSFSINGVAFTQEGNRGEVDTDENKWYAFKNMGHYAYNLLINKKYSKG